MVILGWKKCKCTFNKVLCDSTMLFSVCLYVLVWVGQGTKQYKYHMSKHDSFKYWVVIFFLERYIYMDTIFDNGKSSTKTTILWQWLVWETFSIIPPRLKEGSFLGCPFKI